MQRLSKAWQIQLIFRSGSLWDVNSNTFPKLSPTQSNRQKAACLHFITLAFHTHHFMGYDSNDAISQHHLSYEWRHAECLLLLKTHQHVLSCFFYNNPLRCGWSPSTRSSSSNRLREPRACTQGHTTARLLLIWAHLPNHNHLPSTSRGPCTVYGHTSFHCTLQTLRFGALGGLFTFYEWKVCSSPVLKKSVSAIFLRASLIWCLCVTFW